MKKLFLLICILFASAVSYAQQGVTLVNGSSCDMIVKIQASETGSPCNIYYTSWISVPANSGPTTYTWAQIASNGWWIVGTPTAGQEIATSYVVDFDPATSCSNAQGVGCTYGTFSANLGTCGSCSGNNIKVDYLTPNAGVWICRIY